MTKWHICIVFPTSRPGHEGLFMGKKSCKKSPKSNFLNVNMNKKRDILKVYGKFSLYYNMQIYRLMCV